MKSNLILLFLLVYFTISCGIINTNRVVSKELAQKGYDRALLSDFEYKWGFNSDKEWAFRQVYLKKYKDSLVKPPFLTIPLVKDSIMVWVGFPGETYRKAVDLTLDTIDVYINNKLRHRGIYPYKLQDRSKYPKLPIDGDFLFLNKRKRKEVALTVVYHNDKRYFDTIVPLRFREIGIFYDEKVSFFFSKPL